MLELLGKTDCRAQRWLHMRVTDSPTQKLIVLQQSDGFDRDMDIVQCNTNLEDWIFIFLEEQVSMEGLLNTMKQRIF